MATEAVLSLDADDFCAWVRGNANYECLESIAGEERICASFVSRAIPLALRAPDIVEGMLARKQPASLTLMGLVALFPVTWDGQRVASGVGGMA